ERRPIALAYLAALDGKLDDAIAQVHSSAGALLTAWWHKLFAGDGYLLAERQQHPTEAIASVRRALAIYGEITVIRETPPYLRRTSRARALLARLLAP